MTDSLQRLKEIKASQADKLATAQRHQQNLDTTKQTSMVVSDSVLSAAEAIIRYLEGHTSKVHVINQLRTISTPDALRLIPHLEKLDKSIQDIPQTDLNPLTELMNQSLEELKKIPKDKVELKEREEKDYTKQYDNLAKLVQEVTKAVKAQKLIAEAPIINVPKADVTVNLDNKPLEREMANVVKAIIKLKFPEYDDKNVVKELKDANKLLKKLLEKPVSSGGSGGIASYIDSTGIVTQAQLTADGAVPVASDSIVEAINNLDIGLTVQGLTVVRPTSYQIINGTLVSGDIDSAKQQDNIYLKIGEHATNGLTVNFTFDMPGKVEEFVFRGKYSGSNTHFIDIYAWDYSLNDFVMISDATTRLSSGTVDITVRIPVLNDNFTDVDGTALVQLRHNTVSYNSNHYLEIDYMDASYRAVVDLAGNLLDKYALYATEYGATYNYVCKEDKDGNWYIQRETISTGIRGYVAGASAVATAWTNRATHTYSLFSGAF